MNRNDFDNAYANAESSPATRNHVVKVDRNFVAEVRLKAGLTQQEFARITGASLGAVRKWERGERSPSGAAQTLVRILASDPALVLAAVGAPAETPRRRKRRAA